MAGEPQAQQGHEAPNNPVGNPAIPTGESVVADADPLEGMGVICKHDDTPQ